MESLLAWQELFPPPGLLSPNHFPPKPIHLPLPVLRSLLRTKLQGILSFPLNKALSRYSRHSYLLLVYNLPGTTILAHRDRAEEKGLASGDLGQAAPQVS